jgi:hypothetical protein
MEIQERWGAYVITIGGINLRSNRGVCSYVFFINNGYVEFETGNFIGREETGSHTTSLRGLKKLIGEKEYCKNGVITKYVDLHGI